MLTSTSRPLRIDTVSPAGNGAIGLTFCPGKVAAGIEGNWQRDLALDLAAVAQYGPAALVTVMEAAELRDVQVPPETLSAEVRKLGIEWHHLPVRDGGVPGEEFERLWAYSGTRLRRHLERGRRIVIHCRGGLGRTGMVAARLLVEMGEPAPEAMRRVRQARGGTIENRAQEEYVARGWTAPPAWQERALACLLGGAVGDGFGYAVEFLTLAEIHQKFGDAGLREPQLERGKLIVSDDTQMTLFTLEGLLRAPHRESLRSAYLDWLCTQGYTPRRYQTAGALASSRVLQVSRAPGNTCLSALQAGGTGTLERSINDSKGCGGVMRVAPVGLFPRGLDAAQSFQLGAEAAAITHGHPSGYLSAAALAAMVRETVNGADLAAAARAAIPLLKARRGHEETLALLERALEAEDLSRLGKGWVGEEALAIGLWAALHARDFRDAVARASNHDGDSDSTAAIAGQLRGAWKGLEEIPHDWITALDVLTPLLKLVGQAHGLSGQAVGLSH